MFKKLKEKITEEVKSSPQRFQQLTQSVSDRLQNASTSDENFFSIGEDDANTSNTSLEPGFTSVSLMSAQENRLRRNSSSSVASDVSFLPRYESFANMYHLQSDLEISASEMEDNASSSSQLGHLSKEQIYSAFQKAQMRYHKYRGRYTDLAKHYKDLERENSKMKSVLVETQDKAIRRVTELKEQCGLEQKAKAHLEGALRDEIDEKQFKIQSLQTKIELLQDAENLENLNKYLTDARQEIESLNERIQEMKANSIIFQTKEQEYKTKIIGLEKEISLFSEREKENNLSLAQNKMELHNELLGKDNEISNLKQENDGLRKSLEANTKLENLQSQNKNLIEKLENLTQKCNGYESELLKMEQYKIELQNSNQTNSELKNRLNEVEEKLETVREDAKKSLMSLENKIREKLEKEFEEKEEEVKNEFKKKFEEISSSGFQELQLSVMEKEEEIKKLREVNEEVLEQLTCKTVKYDDLERNHLELIEDSVGLRSKIGSLEKDLMGMQNGSQVSELKISRLEANIKSLEQEIKDYKELEDKLSTLQTERDNLICELQVKEKGEEYRLENLKEENKEILEKLKEEQERREEQTQINLTLSQEIEHLKTLTQEGRENLEKSQLKFEEEKETLLQKLEASEEAGSSLNTELNKKLLLLQTELEDSVQEKKQLTEKLASSEEELKKLEEHLNRFKRTEEEKESLRQESNALKVQNLEEEVRGLSANLESERKTSADLEENNAKLLERCNQMKISLEELQLVYLQQLEEKDTKMKIQGQTINELSTELGAVKDLLTTANEKITHLKEDSLKHSAEMKQRDEILKEVDLLKELLEEANNKTTIKEHESKKIREDLEEKIQELSKEIEKFSQIERDLSVKIETHEKGLKTKDLQIDALSKKLEEYNELIEERNEGFFSILNNFPGDPPNNFRHNKEHKNLQNLEEKLQNFEQTFCSEKENLSKILTYLKQFEETHSSVVSEKDQLENEKEELLKEIRKLQSQNQEINSTRTSVTQMQEELIRLKEENNKLIEDREQMKQNVVELESRNTQVVSDSNFLSEENTGLLTEIEELKLKNEEVETKFSNAEKIINDLKTNLTKLDDSKANQNQLVELERHISELQHEKQLLKEEIEELKTAPLNHNALNDSELHSKEEDYVKEIENLRTKVVQYKSLDLTNRSSIEFYENELQKLKNQNEKLSRKLDETLVTLNHCSELSHSTEIEYLKNVLYNYMLGKESLVLARVIAAVCKFDPHQTEMILAKEQQKQTLLGQLGIL